MGIHFLILFISSCLIIGESAAVTLISRSAGLQLPSKEEGHTEFEFGDVNGDGQLDLVSVGDHGSPYVNSDQHGIMVWLGDGNGGWAVSQFGNFGYGGCALGDLNLDGFTDVAWGIHHNWDSSGMGSRLMGAVLGDGSGVLWSDYGQELAGSGEDWGMFATALADFDGDGLLDILSQSFGGSNGIRLYRNHGDGTWSQAYALSGGSVGYTIETADINADGYLDIISTRSGTNILLGDGEFGFTISSLGLPATGIHGIAVGDINGDGLQDISFGYSSSGVRCYSFDGSQWNDVSSGLPTAGYHDLTQLGDIDGDGLLDLVAYDPPIGKVFLGDGGGGWSADVTWTMPSPGDASALRVDGDMDHDGREDIAVSASMSGFPFYRNQLRVYSPWQTPTVLAARVVYPQGGEKYRTGMVRFIDWLSAVPSTEGVATVDLELSLSGPDGPWTTIAENQPNSGRYQWAVEAPGASVDARIRVTVTGVSESVQAVSPGGFAIEGDFAAVSPGADPFGALALEIFPNPARGQFTIRADLPPGLPAVLSLIDMSGRLILSRRLSVGQLMGDISLRTANGTHLPAGQYFVQVVIGDYQETRPLIVLPE
jgi:FG-GAP-like repeat